MRIVQSLIMFLGYLVLALTVILALPVWLLWAFFSQKEYDSVEEVWKHIWESEDEEKRRKLKECPFEHTESEYFYLDSNGNGMIKDEYRDAYCVFLVLGLSHNLFPF